MGINSIRPIISEAENFLYKYEAKFTRDEGAKLMNELTPHGAAYLEEKQRERKESKRRQHGDTLELSYKQPTENKFKSIMQMPKKIYESFKGKIS